LLGHHIFELKLISGFGISQKRFMCCFSLPPSQQLHPTLIVSVAPGLIQRDFIVAN